MHRKIALLQLFQKHYSFLSNDAFLTENFDDFSHLLLKNTVFSEKNEFLHIFVGNTHFNGTHGHSNDLHHALEKNLDPCNSNEKMKRLIINNKKALFEKLFHVR